jgi:hypothetical protein
MIYDSKFARIVSLATTTKRTSMESILAHDDFAATVYMRM